LTRQLQNRTSGRIAKARALRLAQPPHVVRLPPHLVRRPPLGRRPIRWAAALFTLLLLLPGLALAQSDSEETRKQLRQLEKDIERINWEISTASTRRSNLQLRLKEAEVELGAVKRKVLAKQSAISQSEEELSTLSEQRDELELSRDQQQERIGFELKTAWKMGQQGQVQVLLNQEDPQTVARSMGYYRYFFDARNKLLDQYRGTLLEIEALQLRINATLKELQRSRQALKTQQAELAKAQGTRELALLEINSSIADKDTQLKQKQADRKELEQLLVAIEEAVDKLELPDNYLAFNSAKGKMPWPVAGKRNNRFGRPRNEGKMRWQGISIAAKEGTTVSAIHHGRVVYADWLRGSGLLLIIDHGDGYMSLYAHNQSLLKDVGEWVTADTAISTIGSTGGQARTALYFEIRKDGKPTDPAKWCKG
jgi:septal ring factor EnvC (AmiA/AmiB activator)